MEPNYLISPKIAVYCWLTAMVNRSREGSLEGIKAVQELADEELPGFESFPKELQEQINEIKNLAKSEEWTASLSPKADKVRQCVRTFFSKP